MLYDVLQVEAPIVCNRGNIGDKHTAQSAVLLEQTDRQRDEHNVKARTKNTSIADHPRYTLPVLLRPGPSHLSAI